MPPIQRPEVDRRSFGPETLKYHERLTPFLDGTAAALSALRSFTLLNRDPIRFTTPDDWVTITTASPWAASGGGRETPKYRRRVDGMVEVSGAFTRTGAPAGVENIATGLPKADGLYSFPVSSNAGYGAVDINASGNLVWVAGGTSLTIINGTYRPADTAPTNWATPIEVACSFTPGLVLLVAAEVDAARRTLGERITPSPVWKPTETGLVLIRCPELLPRRTYNLAVYALPT